MMVNLRRMMLVLLLFLFVFGVSEFSSASVGNMALSASEESISQGGSGYIDVSLSGDVDVSMFSFAIFYDHAYLDVGYVKDDSLVEGLDVDFEEDGVIYVDYDGEDITVEGLLLEVFFNVDVDTPVGLYPVEIVVDEAKNALDEDIVIDPFNGTITVEAKEIVVEEITFYSKISQSEGLMPIVLFEVYAEDYQNLTAFEAIVTYDASHFFPFDASFGDSLGDGSLYGMITSTEGYTEFVYAGDQVIENGEPLLQVRLEVIDLAAFTSSISFDATKLVNDELRDIESNVTSKEVKMDEGLLLEDYPDLYVTSYGGSQNQSFDLYVKIEEGSDLSIGEFNLTYDEEMLEVVRVQVGHQVNNKGGALFFEDDVYDGDIHFSYFNETGLVVEDTFLIVTFKAKEGTLLTSSSVSINGERTISADYGEIDLDYIDGMVDFYTAFLVKFVDYNNDLLSSMIYEEDEEIVAPDVPLRENTVFKEWSEAFDYATRNQTVKAVYSLVEEEIVMDNQTLTYDGQMHSLEVSGLPVGASVDYSNNEFKDVGSYTVTEDVYLDGVFQFTLEGTLEIVPKAITVTVGSHERVYDSVGSIAYTVNGKVAGDDLEIEVFSTDGYDVGVHALTAVVHNENYVASVIDGTLEITKATYDMSNVSFHPVSYTRGGNTYYVYVSGTLPEGVSVSYINNGKTEIGTYTVTAEFYGDYQNYHEIDSMSTTLTIDAPTILGPTFIDKSVVYDGTLKSIQVMNIPSGASVVYNVDNSYRNAGSYTVEATISKDGYEDMTLTATLTIEQASYDMSGVSFDDASYEFDGGTSSLLIDGTLPFGVSVTYENNGQKEVGVYEVIAHFQSDDPNYVDIPSMSAILTVLDNDYVDIVFDDLSVVYDGEIHALDLLNVPEGASVSYSMTNEFVDAGEYVVTATIIMNGYDPYQMTATLTIEKEVLVIQAENKSSVYGEELLELTYTVEGTVYHDEVNIMINRESNIAAGVYDITVDAVHPNYDITLIDGTYTIEKATYDMSGITFDHVRVVYDGEIKLLTITGVLPVGVSVEYLNNGQSAVGIYTVTASFITNDPNYYEIAPMQARLVIEAADIEGLVFDSLLVEYDGVAHTLEVENMPAGATVVYTPSNTYTASGVYHVTAMVSLEGHNDQILEATLTINGIDVDTSILGFHDETYVFDDEVKTLLLDGTLPEGVIGVEYLNHRRIAAGSQVVLLKVFVEDGYNPVANMAAVLTVSPAEIEGITFSAGEYVYDGTEKTFSLSGNIAQYGHELIVEYHDDLHYINAGSYTVSVTLSHPNYQSLTLEATLVINKAPRVIDESEFELLVFDDYIQIVREDLIDLIYYSVDQGPFVYGTTIPFLEENTRYSVRIYLEETMNYERSNIALFSEKTYLSTSTVETMISAIGVVRLSSREDIIEVLNHIDLLIPSEQEAQSLALSQVIEEYNLLVETYQYEYKLAGDIVENIFPMDLYIGNTTLATLEDIKRRDLV